MEAIVKDFREYLERQQMYDGVVSLIRFDAQTGAPAGGALARAKRAGFFAGERFGMSTSKEMAGFLEKLEPHLGALKQEDPVTYAMYKKAKRDYERLSEVPVELVRNLAEATGRAEDVWRKARPANDFEMFAPYLKQGIDLKKQILKYRKDKQGYEAFLDDYEQDFTIADADEYFTKLKASVVPLFKRVQSSRKEINTRCREIFVDLETQRKLSDFIAKKLGYDMERGMIRESAHPFCSAIGGQSDVRITTRYKQDDFMASFFAVMHECGHAFYEMNKREDIAETILDRGHIGGVHESQSRFFENIVGRSPEFWEHITDELKYILPSSFKKISSLEFFEAANKAEASLIRVEADELTYSLHILLRYELEKLIFDDAAEFDVSKLPTLWNEKMEEYIGIVPPTDANGVLQDIHWSMASYGYFPTYSFGSALASQFSAHMAKELDVDVLIRRGDFSALGEWMRKNIQQHGLIYTRDELLDQACGERLNVEHYIKYLESKFSKLYEL